MIGINLLCAAKEYDQIYWVMYSGQSFKFKGLCVVVHPINWVMYSNPALKIIGLFVVVHPINWDTSHTIQYIRIHHRQSNILGYTGCPAKLSTLGFFYFSRANLIQS